jgi:hypothetical protein
MDNLHHKCGDVNAMDGRAPPPWSRNGGRRGGAPQDVAVSGTASPAARASSSS